MSQCEELCRVCRTLCQSFRCRFVELVTDNTSHLGVRCGTLLAEHQEVLRRALSSQLGSGPKISVPFSVISPGPQYWRMFGQIIVSARKWAGARVPDLVLVWCRFRSCAAIRCSSSLYPMCRHEAEGGMCLIFQNFASHLRRIAVVIWL